MQAQIVMRELTCRKCNLKFDSWEPFELHHTRHAASNSVSSFPRVQLQRLRVPSLSDKEQLNGSGTKNRKAIPVIKIEDSEKLPCPELVEESSITGSGAEQCPPQPPTTGPLQTETTPISAIGVPGLVLEKPVLAISKTATITTTGSSSLRLKPMHELLNAAHLAAEPVPVSACLPHGPQDPVSNGAGPLGSLLQVTSSWCNPQSGIVHHMLGPVSIPRMPASSAPSIQPAPVISRNRAVRASAPNATPSGGVVVRLALPSSGNQLLTIPGTNSQTVGANASSVSRVYQIQVRESVVQPSVTSQGHGSSRLLTQSRTLRPNLTRAAAPRLLPKPTTPVRQSGPPLSNIGIPQAAAVSRPSVPTVPGTTCFTQQTGPRIVNLSLPRTTTCSQSTIMTRPGTFVSTVQHNGAVSSSFPQPTACHPPPTGATCESAFTNQAGPQQPVSTSQATTSQQQPTIVTRADTCVFPRQNEPGSSTAIPPTTSCSQPSPPVRSETATADPVSTAGDSRLAIPVVDMSSSQTIAALKNLGVRHYVPLSSGSLSANGLLAIPIIVPDSEDQRLGNLCSLGYINLGHAKQL